MFDTEKFISEVEKRPALYNMKMKEYSNRDIKFQLWEEVAVEMYSNWFDLSNEERDTLGKGLKTKWKSIRDQFIRELRCQKDPINGITFSKKKKYIYFDQLLFLTSHCEQRPGSSNLTDNEDPLQDTWCIDIKEEHIVDPLETCLPSPSSTSTAVANKRKRRRVKKSSDNTDIKLCHVLTTSPDQQAENYDSDKMGNKAFLMSLLPLMNNLKQDVIIDARLGIMHAIQMCQKNGASPNTRTPASICSELSNASSSGFNFD